MVLIRSITLTKAMQINNYVYRRDVSVKATLACVVLETTFINGGQLEILLPVLKLALLISF